jgi:hypothetical protein
MISNHSIWNHQRFAVACFINWSHLYMDWFSLLVNFSTWMYCTLSEAPDSDYVICSLELPHCLLLRDIFMESSIVQFFHKLDNNFLQHFFYHFSMNRTWVVSNLSSHKSYFCIVNHIRIFHHSQSKGILESPVAQAMSPRCNSQALQPYPIHV